jgi:hypothetical protein
MVHHAHVGRHPARDGRGGKGNQQRCGKSEDWDNHEFTTQAR